MATVGLPWMSVRAIMLVVLCSTLLPANEVEGWFFFNKIADLGKSLFSKVKSVSKAVVGIGKSVLGLGGGRGEPGMVAEGAVAAANVFKAIPAKPDIHDEDRLLSANQEPWTHEWFLNQLSNRDRGVCERIKVHKLGRGSAQDCQDQCGKASNLVVPWSLREYECVLSQLGRNHQLPVWTGLILQGQKRLMDPYSKLPTVNFAKSRNAPEKTGVFHLKSNMIVNNCVFLFNNSYTVTTCDKRLNNAHCACLYPSSRVAAISVKEPEDSSASAETCDGVCRRTGHLAVPIVDEEYRAILTDLEIYGDRSRPVWLGLLQRGRRRQKKLLNRYTLMKVENHAHVKSYSETGVQAYDNVPQNSHQNCIYLHNQAYVSADCHYELENALCACQMESEKCRRLQIVAPHRKTLDSVDSCEKTCGNHGHLLVPETDSEFTCVEGKLGGHLKTPIWLGLIERGRKVLIDRYDFLPVKNFARRKSTSKTGVGHLKSHSQSDQCVYMYDGFYHGTSCQEEHHQAAKCACVYGSNICDRVRIAPLLHGTEGDVSDCSSSCGHHHQLIVPTNRREFECMASTLQPKIPMWTGLALMDGKLYDSYNDVSVKNFGEANSDSENGLGGLAASSLEKGIKYCIYLQDLMYKVQKCDYKMPNAMCGCLASGDFATKRANPCKGIFVIGSDATPAECPQVCSENLGRFFAPSSKAETNCLPNVAKTHSKQAFWLDMRIFSAPQEGIPHTALNMMNGKRITTYAPVIFAGTGSCVYYAGSKYHAVRCDALQPAAGSCICQEITSDLVCADLQIIKASPHFRVAGCKAQCSEKGMEFFGPASFSESLCMDHRSAGFGKIWVNVKQKLFAKQSSVYYLDDNNGEKAVMFKVPVTVADGHKEGINENCVYYDAGRYYGTKCTHGVAEYCACTVHNSCMAGRSLLLQRESNLPKLVKRDECIDFCSANEMNVYLPDGDNHECVKTLPYFRKKELGWIGVAGNKQQKYHGEFLDAIAEKPIPALSHVKLINFNEKHCLAFLARWSHGEYYMIPCSHKAQCVCSNYVNSNQESTLAL